MLVLYEIQMCIFIPDDFQSRACISNTSVNVPSIGKLQHQLHKPQKATIMTNHDVQDGAVLCTQSGVLQALHLAVPLQQVLRQVSNQKI